MGRAARPTQLYFVYKYLSSMVERVSRCTCGLSIAADIVVKGYGPAPAAPISTAASILLPKRFSSLRCARISSVDVEYTLFFRDRERIWMVRVWVRVRQCCVCLVSLSPI